MSTRTYHAVLVVEPRSPETPGGKDDLYGITDDSVGLRLAEIAETLGGKIDFAMPGTPQSPLIIILKA